MRVEIRTTKYEFSHGKRPKGTGGWAFLVMLGRSEVETLWAPSGMSLTDAKAWAKQECAERFPQEPNIVLEVAP